MHWTGIVGEEDAGQLEQDTKFAKSRFAGEIDRQRSVDRLCQFGADSRFNFLSDAEIRRSAENEPAAFCPSLNFYRCGNKSLCRPALGRSVFSAGIQAEDRFNI